MSENLYEVLEDCLREMEGGMDLESVLVRRPKLADELHPLLKASASAKRLAGGDPSPDVLRRARARVLQRAAEMREAESLPRGRSIPAIRRLLISFALTFLLLISGGSLLRASASALPGERLYSVKRGWENVRLALILDPNARAALESHFYYERLSEVTRLLAQGRTAPVEFAGIYFAAGDRLYVAGIRIVVPDFALLPSVPLENGMAVRVRGKTTADGMVQADSIQLLPGGSSVPAGTPPPIPPTSTPTFTPQPPTLTPSPTPGADGSNENVNVNDGGNVNKNQNDNRNDNDDGIGGNDNGNDDGADDNDNVNDGDDGDDDGGDDD